MIDFPIERLLHRIKSFVDPRRKAGKRHPLETVLSIVVCAVLCGCRGYRAIGAWSQSLTREELIRFGSNRDTPPSEPAIRRLIQRIDADEFDRFIGQWLLDLKLPGTKNSLNGCGIAIDGKTVRGSHNGSQKGIHLLSAVIHREGVVLAQEEVSEKTNEIKHVKPLLDDLNIEGAIVTADALHTQKEFANYLVEEKKADFILIAKENQPTLMKDIRDIMEEKKTSIRTSRPVIKVMDESSSVISG